MSVKTVKKEVASVLPGKLREARVEAGMNQPKLASLLGKSRTWVALRESGARRIYKHQLETIAKLTHKPVSWFYNKDTEKEKIVWEAKQYKSLMKDLEKMFSTKVSKHYTEMTDDEIDMELERLGIADFEFKRLFKAVPILTDEEKEKIVRSLRHGM